MNDNNYCVIMGGGIGSRFWPFSRENYPKQFSISLELDDLYSDDFRSIPSDYTAKEYLYSNQ